MFPTRMRGAANAIILSFSKFGGSFAPEISSLSKDNGYHVLCGCCLLTIISLPLSFCLKESLELRDDEGLKSELDHTESDISDGVGKVSFLESKNLGDSFDGVK